MNRNYDSASKDCPDISNIQAQLKVGEEKLEYFLHFAINSHLIN